MTCSRRTPTPRAAAGWSGWEEDIHNTPTQRITRCRQGRVRNTGHLSETHRRMCTFSQIHTDTHTPHTLTLIKPRQTDVHRDSQNTDTHPTHPSNVTWGGRGFVDTAKSEGSVGGGPDGNASPLSATAAAPPIVTAAEGGGGKARLPAVGNVCSGRAPLHIVHRLL